MNEDHNKYVLIIFPFTIEIKSSYASMTCENNATPGVGKFSSGLITAIKSLAHFHIAYKPKVQTIQPLINTGINFKSIKMIVKLHGFIR